MEITAISTKDTQKLASELAKILKPKDVIALYGDLGSGKTTFTNFLVAALGITSRVQSPTFVLLRKYSSQDSALDIKTIQHLDLYRLTTEAEVLELGITDLFEDPNAITVIEWPEVAKNLLPEATISINFEQVAENIRRINVQNLS